VFEEKIKNNKINYLQSKNKRKNKTIMKSAPKLILAAAGFIVSGFMLGIKMLNPTQIQITIEGSETKVLPIQAVFTFQDVLIITVSTAVLCLTAMYIWYYTASGAGKVNNEKQELENEKQKIELEKQKWQHILKTLKNDEKIIYETIFAEDGIMFQNELIEKTGFSAAKVTRCLDALENRGIVKKTRKGLYNIISL